MKEISLQCATYLDGFAVNLLLHIPEHFSRNDESQFVPVGLICDA
jgi:hypothetical protein